MQRLPEADVVIDPKQESCSYPYDGICGAFVAYKLVQVLFEKAQKAGKVTPETAAQTVRELTEPAAIATICDVMQLLDENRILVKYGLRFMEQSQNLGIRTLLDVCGISSAKLTNYHIGFIVGPCLNATGRLDSAMRGLELLEAQKERETVVLATELKEMNESRKALTEQATEEAVRQVEEGELQENTVLVIYLPDCHESIAGIVAGRIREKYNRPVFVVTDAEDGLKGSGRSIEAYHMYEGLHAVEELLGKYGGHKLAAGFSLPKENLQEFKRQLNEQSRLTEEDFVKRVMIDVPMPVRYASVEFVNELSRLEPFGNGNPKPVFADRALQVSQFAVRGKNRNVAGFLLKDAGGFSVEGIYFGEADRFVEDVTKHGSCINILYYPQLNTFRGKTTLQVVVTSYQFPKKIEVT
jgi:single-stranded-DNA-specific exonuclease